MLLLHREREDADFILTGAV